MNEEITKSSRLTETEERTETEEKGFFSLYESYFARTYRVKINRTEYPVTAVIPLFENISKSDVTDKIKKLITEID